MNATPSPNGANAGRFKPGNPGGPGNPHARQVAALRSALLNAVTPADMRAIIAKLIREAKRGSIPAAREIIERTLGKPVEPDLLERIERLERQLSQPEGNP